MSISSNLFNMQRFDYLNPNLWDFYFEDNPELRFLVKSVPLPFKKLEVETRNTGHKVLKGFTPEETITIEFKETSDLQVYHYMQDWIDRIFDNRTKKFGTGYSYVKSALLTLSKPTPLSFLDSSLVEYTKTFKFKNLMLLGFEDLTFNYEETDNKVISCSFSVDEVVPWATIGI